MIAKKTVTVSSGLIFGFSALWGIGDVGNGHLILDVNTEIEYDSNVFMNDQEVDDFVSRLDLGLAFEQDKKSLANLQARAGLEMVRFNELLEQDAENFEAKFDLSYPNNVESNLYYSIGATWDRKTRSRKEVGRRLKSDRFAARGSLLANFNQKSGMRVNAWIEQESFSDKNFIGSKDALVVADYLHRYSSKMNAVVGYRYHELDYGGASALNQVGHVLSFGGDGHLTAKIDGFASFGFQYLDMRFDLGKSSDELQFFYDLDLNWQAGDKTEVSLSGSSDFINSPTGEINNHKDIGILVHRAISDRSRGRAGIAWIEDDYQGALHRREKAIRVDTNYSIYFANRSTLGATVQFERRKSPFAQFNYDHLKFTIEYLIMF